MMRTTIVGGLAATLLAGAASSAQAQGLGSLGNIFNCSAPGSSQTGGAVIGGLLGGLAGAGVARNDAVGAVLGAAVGAAAGSWVGCRLQSHDQVSLEDATRRALEENRSTTWSNPQTGASARIDVYADTSSGYGSSGYASRYGAQGYSPYTSTPRYGDWMPSSQVRLATRVSAANGYETVAPRHEALTTTAIRTAPSLRARANGRLGRGEAFQALGKVQGAPWILVGRNGVGVGYVPQSAVEPITETVTSSDYAAEIPAQSIRLNGDVRWAGTYETAPTRYSVVSDAYLRSEPTLQGRSLGGLYRGDQVEALARVRGTSWVLLGRNGYGIGYAPESVLQPLDAAPTYAASTTSDCRIVEQAVTTPGSYAAQTQRYRACRDYSGRWNLAAL